MIGTLRGLKTFSDSFCPTWKLINCSVNTERIYSTTCSICIVTLPEWLGVYILTIFLWSSSVKEGSLVEDRDSSAALIHVWTVTGYKQVNNQEQKQSCITDLIITVDMQRDTFFILFRSCDCLTHSPKSMSAKTRCSGSWNLLWNSEWCNCASEWDNRMMLTLKIIALFTLFFC